MTDRIRIVLADDHELIRLAIARLLSDEPDFEIVAQATNGIEAVALARRLRPDVVLMDIHMPQMDGIDATRLIQSALPEVRVIGLSACDDPGCIHSIRQFGVFAYVTKSSPLRELTHAIRSAVEARAERGPFGSHEIPMGRASKS